MSTKDKWVRRFTVDETAKHKNGFTIYKITSVLFPLESPEAVTVVSVWKRYSDVQALHSSMKALHSGLHLRGTFPVLPKNNYFKRFQSEVIEERGKSIKILLEFIAEHRLLFTSTVFVNFLQTGYPEPVPQGGVINAIRSSLHLPIEETPPLEYQTSDDESRSPNSARTPQENNGSVNNLDISQIPIYEAADVELRQSPRNTRTDSFESINSIESINSDFYDELNKITIEKTKPSVKTKNVLPDLINFDAPSTSNASKFDDYHTMGTETVSIASDSPIRVKEMENSYVFESPLYDTNNDDMSVTSRAMDTEIDGVASPSSGVRGKETEIYEDVSSVSSEVRGKETEIYEGVSSLSSEVRVKETEDSYVFEAGYLLSLGARSEDSGQYRRAFHCYRAGIEKMLIGVRLDCDTQRRALIKEKINKYLNYAETIYNNHLIHTEDNDVGNVCEALCPPPLSMLSGDADELAQYRVLAVLGPNVMLVLHKQLQTCYAMKVIRKIPHNLTEFDEYFLQRTNETRQPILPTLIPYMVPLHAYIQTNNLIFLILTYAPGKKLFDYIKEYKSIPNTPNRQVNLENVFTEPMKKNEINDNNKNDSMKQDINENNDLSVNELVRNSQKLLQNVDKVLTEVRDENIQDVREMEGNDAKINDVQTTLINRPLWQYHRSVFTSHTLLQLPDTLPLEARSLLTQLLTADPSQRLGGAPAGIDEIKQHPYFRGVDWLRVRNAWSVPR
ncbi:Ribosomal protein S6 kinase delta-1 [Papilio xuthus]|uniref:Ribosomal protein S6 kinase delta-1 n=1 Tax=Papilio xuthus TaxID=66420 RepID=A0A194Q5C4_PAPXU|nr:Ribosomal protein S6 kinase delta-1 [Papilio xuthus]